MDHGVSYGSVNVQILIVKNKKSFRGVEFVGRSEDHSFFVLATYCLVLELSLSGA